MRLLQNSLLKAKSKWRKTLSMKGKQNQKDVEALKVLLNGNPIKDTAVHNQARKILTDTVKVNRKKESYILQFRRTPPCIKEIPQPDEIFMLAISTTLIRRDDIDTSTAITTECIN